MKLGAEPKRLAVLAVLMVVAAYLAYTNLFSEDGRPAAAPAARPGPQTSLAREMDAPPAAEPRAPAPSRSRSAEFRPALRSGRTAEITDLLSDDPTLRLDLLARVQAVTLESSERSLFQFSAPPAPRPFEVKPASRPPEPSPAENRSPGAASKPPPTPIPLKFFGYSSDVRAGRRRAFFMDGDEILMAGEGELIKRRYKVVRIGINSCVVEDTEQQYQQTLPLEERPG